MATCTFNIIEDATMDVKVNDITSSDYTKAVDNGDFNVKLRKGESEIIIENVPNTSAELTIMYIAFGFIFMIFGGILLMKFMNHKKMAGIAIFLLLLLIPFSTYAQRDKSSLSDVDLSNIRKMLLNEKDVDKELDLDGDKNVTINDLIITKVDLYALNIDFSITNQKSGIMSGVYLSLEKNIKVTSTADITSLKYCVDYKTCVPNREVKINKKVKELSEKVTFNENMSSSKQRICVTATNSKGKERTICDIGYIIDNVTPVVSVKDASVNGDVQKLGIFDMRDNVKAVFGYSGGNVSCQKVYVSTNSDKTSDIYTVNKVTCNAKGNNGKTVSINYVLNGIDSVVPELSTKGTIPIYNREIEENYDYKQHINATFGKKGGIVTCTDKVVVNEEDTEIHRTHTVTCVARGNNTKEKTVDYKIIEYDNSSPYFDVKKGSVDFEANTSSGYDYKNNVINSRFGIKGGSITCTAGPFENNSGTGNNLYRTKVVTCVADGNNGQIYKRNYAIRELDNVTPTITFKNSIIDYNGILPSGYDYTGNISNVQYGAKGGSISCSLMNTTAGDSNVYKNKTISCTATGNNGKRAASTYTIRELDNTTPVITATRSEVQFTNTSSEGYNLVSNVSATYGLKGGSITCEKQAYTYNTGTSSNIYRIANVLCYANGNNGKRSSVSYGLVELDTVEPIFDFYNSLISIETDINSYNYLSNISNIRFGAKGGTKSCYLQNVTPGAIGSSIYKSGIVKCTVKGNNGKELIKAYTLQEMDFETPYFTFKTKNATMNTELYNDLSANIATITYGKKGGTVTCKKTTTTAPYNVKCTATGNNGRTYSDVYTLYQ